MAPTPLDSEIERFEAAIKHYKEAIAAIEAAKNNPEKLSANLILELVIAHNAVEEVKDVPTIKAAIKNPNTPSDLKDRIEKAHKEFDILVNDSKKQIESIKRTIRLFELQASNEKDWWWLLHPITPRPWRDRLDWLWRFLSLVFLTASFSILAESSTRFLSAGPDSLGFFAVIFPSVLTLITSGGALTKPGKEAIERILISWKINKSWWDEAICILSALLLVIMIGLWFSLPHYWAKQYKKWGDLAYYQSCGNELEVNNSESNNADKDEKTYDCSKLASAQKQYERAIKLDPEYTEAHYELGKVYEELQENSQAITQYKIAVKGGWTKAYNDLAKMYIKEKKYSQADEWLLKCVSPKQQETKSSQKNPCTSIEKLAYEYIQTKQHPKAIRWLKLGLEHLKGADTYKERRSVIFTYLGWSFLKQKNYRDADFYLQQATNLKPDKGFTHCLWADVQENIPEKKQNAIKEWEKCHKYGDLHDPNEGELINIARQRIEEKQPVAKTDKRLKSIRKQ